MRRVFLALAFVFIMVSSAYAQHPCDVVPPTVFQEPSAQLAKLKLGWCFNPLDVMTGAPIAEPIGFSLVIDGGPDVDLGVVPAIGAASATGWFYYETQTPALKAGVLTLKAYTPSLGMSAASAPVTLTLLGPPKPPTGLRILKGGMGPQP